MLDTTRNSYCSGVSQLPQNSQKNYSTAQTSSRGRAERCDRERNTMASFGGVEASNKAARTTVDVVIVGGGLSGLCAARLLAPGLSFLVLEANEHRFGGRLRNADVTHYASALRIDMGAAWVWPQVIVKRLERGWRNGRAHACVAARGWCWGLRSMKHASGR